MTWGAPRRRLTVRPRRGGPLSPSPGRRAFPAARRDRRGPDAGEEAAGGPTEAGALDQPGEHAGEAAVGEARGHPRLVRLVGEAAGREDRPAEGEVEDVAASVAPRSPARPSTAAEVRTELNSGRGGHRGRRPWAASLHRRRGRPGAASTPRASRMPSWSDRPRVLQQNASIALRSRSRSGSQPSQ